MLDEQTPQVRVLVVDDDLAMRESIHWTLTSVGYEVQAFASASECLQAIDAELPHCIVVDLLLPGMTGLRFCQEIVARNAHSTFLMISGHGDVVSAVEVMKLGAIDFLEKPFSRELLLRGVASGIEQALALHRAEIERAEIDERFTRLSTREREILELVAAGLVSKQIAAKLNISPRTVDVHRSNILHKLQIDSPAQLAHVLLLHQRHQAGRRLGTVLP